jgi:hypothetical protein
VPGLAHPPHASRLSAGVRQLFGVLGKGGRRLGLSLCGLRDSTLDEGGPLVEDLLELWHDPVEERADDKGEDDEGPEEIVVRGEKGVGARFPSPIRRRNSNPSGKHRGHPI